jgi:Glycosyl transferase family 2
MVRETQIKHVDVPLQHNDQTWIDRTLDFLRNHRQPPIVEFFLAWLAAFFCLLYYGYQYITSLRKVLQYHEIPLMTEVRKRNVDHTTETQRLYQNIKKTLDVGTNISVTHRDKIISLIRNDESLRRNVSQFNTYMSDVSTDVPTREMMELRLFLISIWPELLRLPAHDEEIPNREKDSQSCRLISLVIPAFKESGHNINRVLQVAWNHCCNPESVQVVIVDAGYCTDLDHILCATNGGSKKEWGELKIVQYTGNGGRGPCQNFGANHATGDILTFLHSDTLLPQYWDSKVQTTLRITSEDGVITHACSFSVGHNVSKEGLGGIGYPWGIRSILLLGNIRAFLFRLPYGDHILSFNSSHFRYVGGFPNQPIMEDYCIIDLFRCRAAQMPETLRIIPPPTGLCSVRRWQMCGVPYVTLANALIVYRFANCGWTADEVFDYYYHRPQSQNKDE